MASNISVVLQIDNTQYIADLKRAETATKDFGDKAESAVNRADNSFNRLGRSTNTLSSEFAKLTTLLTGAAIVGFAINAVRTADAIDDLSKATGIAIDKILAFQDAAGVAGAKAEASARGIEILYTKIDEAAKGSGDLQAAFEKVGITLNDLRTLSEQDILQRTLEGLAAMDKSAQKTALQGELLGKAFRGVNIDREFIDNLRAGEAEALRTAAGIEAAAKANEQFEKSLNTLRNAFLQTFAPAFEQLAQFTLNAENARETVLKVGAAVGIAFGVVVFNQIAQTVKAIGEFIIFVGRAALALRSAAIAAAAFMAATGPAGWAAVAAGVAAAGAAIVGLNKLFDEANEKISQSGLIAPPPTAAPTPQQNPAAAAAQQAAQAAQAEAARNQREVQAALQKTREEVEAITRSYENNTNKLKRNIELETELIGVNKSSADIRRAQAESENRARQEIDKLEETIRRVRTQEKGSEEDKRAAIATINAQIDAIKRLSSEEQARLAIQLEEKNRREVANRVSVLGLERELELQKQVRQINDEVASMFLPELERRLLAVRSAADESARAQIANLAAQQQMTVADFTAKYPEQVARIREQASAVNELTAAERRRIEAQQEQRQLTFELQTRIDYERELQKILDEQAKMGLSEIERKYYDISAAARDSAQARIRAEEQARFGARAGTAPEYTLQGTDPAAVQRIMQEANRGTAELQRQTEVLYENSRKFETGWNRAFREYVDNATNAAKSAERIFGKVTQGLEDMFVGFIKTGKFEWKGFVSTIAEELLRSNIRNLIGQVFGPIGGGQGSGGGLLGGLGNIFGGGGQSGAGNQGSQGGGLFGGLFGGGQASGTRNAPFYVVPVSGQGGAGSLFGGGGFGTPGINGGAGGGGLFGGIGDMIGNVFGGITSTVGNIGRSIGGIFGGGSSGGGLFSGISDLFGGFFANGGSLPAGKFGVVGERGPELIGGPASITPMAGNVTYNINAVDAASFKQLVASDPGFIHAVAMSGARAVPARR